MASGRVAHEAGGGEAEELGFAAASAIAYAKALVAAGLPIGRGLRPHHPGPVAPTPTTS